MSTMRRWATISSSPLALSASQRSASRSLIDQHGQQCGEQIGVATGPRAEVDVGQIGALGAPWVNDDQGTRRIVGDLLEDLAGLWETV